MPIGARALLLAVFAVYLLVGPIGKQLAGAQIPKVFQTWRMFVGIARSTCQVEFSTIDSGVARPFDVTPANAKNKRWRVERKQLSALERRICAQVQRETKKAPDVRVRARCGSRRRWVTERDGTDKVCARRD